MLGNRILTQHWVGNGDATSIFGNSTSIFACAEFTDMRWCVFTKLISEFSRMYNSLGPFCMLFRKAWISTWIYWEFWRKMRKLTYNVCQLWIFATNEISTVSLGHLSYVFSFGDTKSRHSNSSVLLQHRRASCANWGPLENFVTGGVNFEAFQTVYSGCTLLPRWACNGHSLFSKETVKSRTAYLWVLLFAVGS